MTQVCGGMANELMMALRVGVSLIALVTPLQCRVCYMHCHIHLTWDMRWGHQASHRRIEDLEARLEAVQEYAQQSAAGLTNKEQELQQLQVPASRVC